MKGGHRVTIGERIKQVRNAKGLTQKQLGAISGTSEITIRQYELGKRQPRLEQLQRIAEALGTTVNWLLPPDNYWLDESGVEHWESMLPSELALEKRLHDSYNGMTMEGKSKVVNYAEDILPRYRAEPAPPSLQEGTDTTSTPKAPETPPEGEQGKKEPPSAGEDGREINFAP